VSLVGASEALVLLSETGPAAKSDFAAASFMLASIALQHGDNLTARSLFANGS
jgi:hypothetical protein